MKRVVFTLLLSTTLLAGCGPAQVGGDDDTMRMDSGVVPDSAVNPGPDSTFVPPPVTIYAHSRDTLFTVDRTSFAVTTIGPFNITPADDVTDLAVTPTGQLYGISRTKLYTIDRSSGRATLLSTLTGSTSNVGLTFLPGGALLATDKSGGVRRIEPTTGVITEIGTFGNGLNTAGDLVAVADGTMYAISETGPTGTSPTLLSDWLITVNTSTGVGTAIGPIGFQKTFGAAYANGKVYAFTEDGKILEINRLTGVGTVVKTFVGEFWGAGVTSLVPID